VPACSKPLLLGFSEPDAQHFIPTTFQTNLIVPLSGKNVDDLRMVFHDIATETSVSCIKRSVAFSDEVQQEDIGLCESVSVVWRLSTYDRGRYSVKRENGVHHFHMLLGEFLGQV